MIDNNRKELLLNKLNKLNSYHEIQNIMGRLTAALNFQRKDEILSYFALDHDDVSIEYADEGLFVGRKAIEALLDDLVIKDNEKGYMLDMQLTTPMIEIADDVKTAKGLWWTPGIGSNPQDNNDPQALWYWGMLGVDFIYENNTWKVWHLHYFRLIKCGGSACNFERSLIADRPFDFTEAVHSGKCDGSAGEIVIAGAGFAAGAQENTLIFRTVG